MTLGPFLVGTLLNRSLPGPRETVMAMAVITYSVVGEGGSLSFVV